MTRSLPPFTRWVVVVVFAAAMAWVEAAAVYYLRVLVDRLEPHQPNPLPIAGMVGGVELVREAATLIMLVAVGMLAGRTWRQRAGYAAIAFGAWDILYYVFLRIMTGWPRSIFDWDILFLLPLPWWGPVLAPVSIAVLMIVWGTLATQRVHAGAPAALRKVWALNAAGIALALYVFMADSIRGVRAGVDVTSILPSSFEWGFFWVALALMAAPVCETVWHWRQRQSLTTERAGG